MSRIMRTHCINYTIICTGARKSRREGRGLRKLTSKATLCISRSLSKTKPPYRWYSDIFPHKNICRRWHSNILAVIVFNPSPPFFCLTSEGCLEPRQVHLYPAGVHSTPVNTETQETNKSSLVSQGSQHVLRWSATKQTVPTRWNRSDSEDSSELTRAASVFSHQFIKTHSLVRFGHLAVDVQPACYATMNLTSFLLRPHLSTFVLCDFIILPVSFFSCPVTHVLMGAKKKTSCDILIYIYI